MAQRGLPTKKPTALVCGMLEDNGRVLFLVRKDYHGTERIELPSVLVFSSVNAIGELAIEFKRQSGIDGQIHESIIDTRHNAGSRRKKYFVPVLVFKVTAKNRTAKPSSEFSGFCWLSMENAKQQKLDRKLEWIR